MHLVHLPTGAQRTDDAIRTAHDINDTSLVLWSTFCRLSSELAGQHAAVRWLGELVEATGRPIAFSAPSCDSAVETHVLTPPAWSEERTLGWLGGLRAEVTAMYGSTSIFLERTDGFRERLS
ncbi:MAG: hypothetical protein QOF51_1259 [Chloroflexota bacterium]|jgi:hypothetical protein|nr:hypothetical protein [Chloroflexota bacterium]